MAKWRTDWKVGDTCYWFDENKRDYKRDENGRSIGGPIYKAHFRAEKIVGETSRSWIVGKWLQRKIPKATGVGIYDEKMVDDDCWVHSYSYRISDKVSRLDDADLLRKIAEIIEFQP